MINCVYKYFFQLNLAGNPLERVSPRLFLGTKDLVNLDISDCDLTDLWAEPLPRSNVFRNLKMLNASNNKIVQVRQSDLAPLEGLSILDLTQNPEMRCDADFKNLLKWLQKKNVLPNNNKKIIGSAFTLNNPKY